MTDKTDNGQTKTVTPIEACPPHAVCVTMTGLVRKADYIAHVRRPSEEAVAERGWFDFLINYDEDFRGWETEAADLSWRTIIELGSKTRKLAYVNPTDKKIFQHKMSANLYSGEARFFNKGELDQALRWLGEKG